MERRLDAGPLLVALGAAALLIALWVTWYQPGGTAWHAFEVLDLLLAALALGSAAAAFGLLGDGGGRLVLGLALAALVVVVSQLIDPPPAARGADLGTGAWLALAGATVMVVGAVLSQASIAVTVDVKGRDARRRVAAVDRRGTTGAPTEPAERVERVAPAEAPRRPDAATAPAEDGPGMAAREAARAADRAAPVGRAARRKAASDPQRTQSMPAVPPDEPAGSDPSERP
jgi:hypothetical protein